MKTLFRLWRDENGGPAIEFAMVAMFVAISIPAVLDVTTLVQGSTKLSSGTRAGTHYALRYPTDEAGIEETIRQASGLETVAVTSRQFCECNGAESSCTSSCGSNITRKKYSEVVATYDISDQYNFENLYPANLSETITVRIQ